MVTMLCSNKLFASALKLKNSNCDISPLIIWVKFIIKSIMHHNLLDKNMFPVHIPKLHRVVLNPRYIYILYKLREWDIYLFKRATTTVIKMPKGIPLRDWQITFILILILVFSKLKAAFCKYWRSVEIKISMSCVYRVWS